MFTLRRSLLLTLGLLLLAGCAHKQLTAGSVQDIHRLAIVVRVAGAPVVDVARKDPREGRAFASLPPAEADQRLQEAVAKQVTVFELEERIREGLVAKLPAAPPWNAVMSAAEVATVLQSFLVVDHSTPVDYGALNSAGADAILELRVTEWGLINAGKTGLFLKGDGRLMKLPGRSTIWADTLDIDLAKDPEAEAADVMALRNGGFREAVIGLVGRLADRLAPELGGRP
jgi:hypothetical protein